MSHDRSSKDGVTRCRMPFHQRKEWLIEAIRQEFSADVLNQDLVDRYAEHTGARYFGSIIGAGWCPLLAADLRRLYRLGLLKRGRMGMAGNWQPGFPRWVYSYSLNDERKAA